MFFRGLVFTTACLTFLFGALNTFLMASLLGLAELALRHVPYRPSSFLKAASVQMQNLPTWPPGASLSRFRLSTWMVSTPGIFLNALVSPWSRSKITKGPNFWTCLLFLSFPLPALIRLVEYTLATSAQALLRLRNTTASLVLENDWTLSATTSGTSEMPWIWWPLAMTKAGTPVAAIAEQMAYLFWAVLTFLCHLLHVLVGANMRPPLHMLPKAPWPDLWVPPPLTLGILATALPVPQDSALVWCPASTFTQYGCLLFFAA